MRPVKPLHSVYGKINYNKSYFLVISQRLHSTQKNTSAAPFLLGCYQLLFPDCPTEHKSLLGGNVNTVIKFQPLQIMNVCTENHDKPSSKCCCMSGQQICALIGQRFHFWEVLTGKIISLCNSFLFQSLIPHLGSHMYISRENCCSRAPSELKEEELTSAEWGYYQVLIGGVTATQKSCHRNADLRIPRVAGHRAATEELAGHLNQ